MAKTLKDTLDEVISQIINDEIYPDNYAQAKWVSYEGHGNVRLDGTFHVTELRELLKVLDLIEVPQPLR